VARQLTDLLLGPAVEIAEAVSGGAVSATEVLELHLERIAEVNPRLNAIVTLCEPEARAAVFEDANVFGELWWGKRLVGVKVDLAAADLARMEELLTEAWLRRAPKALAAQLDRRDS